MQRLESKQTLLSMKIGRRDMSFGVMVTVIGLRHVSS